jgi:hypothetical protein
VAFAVGAILTHHVRVDAGGNLLVLTHPTGGAAWWGVAGAVFFVMLGISWLASLASQALSYRRSAGERRQQLKWLLAGAVGSGIGLVASFKVLSNLGLPGPVVTLVSTLGWFALPACIAIGVLKYRLFDIDRIISRTLAYTLLTGLLIGVYTGLVLLATQVLRFSSPVSVAAATLAAVALFTPLRHRVQRAVDRRFNRARYDADAAVAAFAARLKDAVNLDSVRDDLAGTVHAALEPAQVSVWITGGSR